MLSRTRSRYLDKEVYFFDCDGTLYLGSRVIPGARELIRKIADAGKSFFYFTNNSSRSDLDYVRKLKKMGFPVTRDQVIVSSQTVAPYLEKRSGPKIKRAYVLGLPALKMMLRRDGIHHDRNRPQMVIVGFDKTLTYEKLCLAARFIEKGLPWIMVHPDRYCPTDEGCEPDAGSIGALLETATGRKAEVALGKPHPLMMKLGLSRAGAKARDALLIGDRLSTDIEMAMQAGIDSVLVLSGETKRKDIPKKWRTKMLVVSSVKDLLE